MASNDQWIGLGMAIIAVLGITYEFIQLIVRPAADNSILANLPSAQYWALAIPIFLGVFGVLAIVLWIGVTMFRTPPPEAWDFEEFEEDETEASAE